MNKNNLCVNMSRATSLINCRLKTFSEDIIDSVSVSLAVDPERTNAREWLPGRTSEISDILRDYQKIDV